MSVRSSQSVLQDSSVVLPEAVYFSPDTILTRQEKPFMFFIFKSVFKIFLFKDDTKPNIIIKTI